MAMGVMMGKAVNKVFLIGRLTKDVELRVTPSGKNVASFTLAVDKQGQDAGANFFDVTAWDKLAELVNQYCQKGSQIHVEGLLDQQTWEQDGNKRSKVVVIARDVTFLGGNQAQQTQTTNTQATTGEQPIDLSEIPF